MGVRVGVPQLVCDAVEEDVPALCLQRHCQVLQYVHVCRVGDGGGLGGLVLGTDERDGRGANVHSQGVYQLKYSLFSMQRVLIITETVFCS